MVNADKPGRWNDDIRASVELYNRWFLRFAPTAFQSERSAATAGVLAAFAQTTDLGDLSEPAVRTDTRVFAALQMCCAPPIARDRLAGLAGVNTGTVKTLESGRLPRGGGPAVAKLVAVIQPLLDGWLFPWLAAGDCPSYRCGWPRTWRWGLTCRPVTRRRAATGTSSDGPAEVRPRASVRAGLTANRRQPAGRTP